MGATSLGLSEGALAVEYSDSRKDLARLNAYSLELHKGKESKVSLSRFIKDGISPYVQFIDKELSLLGEKDGIKPDGNYQLTVSDNGITLDEVKK